MSDDKNDLTGIARAVTTSASQLGVEASATTRDTASRVGDTFDAGYFAALKLCLSEREVLIMVGFGRTKWNELVKRGEAPQPIRRGRKKLWLKSEILAWIDALAAERSRG